MVVCHSVALWELCWHIEFSSQVALQISSDFHNFGLGILYLYCIDPTGRNAAEISRVSAEDAVDRAT